MHHSHGMQLGSAAGKVRLCHASGGELCPWYIGASRLIHPGFSCAPPLARLEVRRRLVAPPVCGGKGFAPQPKSSGGSSNTAKGSGDPSKAQAKLQQSRQVQLQATEVLAQLLAASDPAATAAQLADSLNEEFFMVADAYLGMAKREGNAEVASQLEAGIRAAMAEMQKRLRPEIQLLNTLMGEDSSSRRQQLIAAKGDVLSMNDRYFFSLLERMASDVAMRPVSEQQVLLLSRLCEIRAEASLKQQLSS